MNLRPLPRALTLAAAIACSTAPALAARDEAIFNAASAVQPNVVDTLKEMVLIESGTRDPQGIARMADLLQRRLVALGAKVDRRPTTGGNGSDVLVGQWTGNGRRKILLIAHMDTVYAPGILQTQPLKQDGNRLYGPGIADDKGGIAVILHSIEILQKQGWKDFATLTVLFNGDEESGSTGSSRSIVDMASQHDVVLSFEPTAANIPGAGEGVLLSAAGTATAVIEVKGKASHAGAAPELGRNALLEASFQMLQTEKLAKDIPGAQLNWTQFTTGTIPNQIPEVARASADVRLTRKDAADKLRTALQQKVASGRHVPDTQSTVTLTVGRPPYERNDRTDALGRIAQEIYAEMGSQPLKLYPVTGGATDASFAQQPGNAAVLESMGLPGAGYHARDEYIELDSIPRRVYLACRMLMRLAQGQ
jgi:glutamate carboxypeptidase